jgi:hypothetical protein
MLTASTHHGMPVSSVCYVLSCSESVTSIYSANCGCLWAQHMHACCSLHSDSFVDSIRKNAGSYGVSWCGNKHGAPRQEHMLVHPEHVSLPFSFFLPSF